jgi:hypothetical protein
MASKTADAIKLVLRLPKPIHKRLKQQARRNKVSLNTEIVNLLEGAETATAKRMAEAMKPLVQEAIKQAVGQATGRLPSDDDLRLEMILLNMPAPHTEAALEERLRKSNAPPDKTAKLLQLFRERQAGGPELPPWKRPFRPLREPEQK